MQYGQKTKKINALLFFFLGIGFLVAGRVFLFDSSIGAQLNQGSRLEWVEGQRKDPMIVTGQAAIFRIKFIDDLGRNPNISQLRIDVDGNGQYDDNEKISLEEDISKANSSERIYSTTLYFDPNRQIKLGTMSDFKKLPESFRAAFCFYFAVDGQQIPEEVIDGDPADPNNQLIVLGKTDEDKDKICDAEEGVDLLPESYWQDPNYAYRDKMLAAIRTPGGKIILKINQGRFRNVYVASENDPNRPEDNILGLNFPYGFISFRIEDLIEDVVELRILFPNQITNYAEFCRYSLEIWRARIEYSPFDDDNYDAGNAWRYESFPGIPEMERRGLMLKLIDNDSKFDSNNEEGKIDDPLGLGIPKESGEGRCFLSYIAR